MWAATFIAPGWLLLCEAPQQRQKSNSAPAPVNATARADLVRPLLAEALARWQSAGIDTSAVRGIDVRIADPGGLMPGKSAHAVLTTPGERGERGRMDLLTVLEYETGRRLGHDQDAGGLMQETLDAGSRRTTDPTLLQDTDRLGDAPTLSAGDAYAPGSDRGPVSRNGKTR
jgi:hypothetical protein